MKILSLLVLFLFLAGCAAPVWETVEDVHPLIPAAVRQDPLYTVQFGLPENMALVDETSAWKLYSTPQGDLEVEAGHFLASDLNHAVRMLSGYEADRLTILQTSRFDLPQYRFAWLTQTEQGSRLCSADLVLDGMDCYAVVCSRLETAGGTYEEAIRSVFSSFGLFTDEGV